MPHRTIVNSDQMLVGIFLCLVSDSLIRPLAGGAALSAYGRVISAVICAGVVYLMLRMMFRGCASEAFIAVLAGKSTVSKPVLGLLTASFLLGAGRSLQQTEKFYRYVTGEGLSIAVLMCIVLAVSLYAAFSGFETVLRAGSVLLFFLACSIVLILVGNAPQMRLENLQIPTSPLQDIWSSCTKGFNLTPELLLIAVFAHSCRQKNPSSILRNSLLLTVVVDLLLTVVSELVMGQFEALQVQPIHTLARLGGISVFRRLDAVHVSIWLLVSIFRTALLCVGLGEVLRPLIAQRYRQAALWCVAVPVLVVAGCMYIIPEGIQQWVETGLVFTGAVSIWYAVTKEKKKWGKESG